MERRLEFLGDNWRNGLIAMKRLGIVIAVITCVPQIASAHWLGHLGGDIKLRRDIVMAKCQDWRSLGPDAPQSDLDIELDISTPLRYCTESDWDKVCREFHGEHMTCGIDPRYGYKVMKVWDWEDLQEQ